MRKQMNYKEAMNKANIEGKTAEEKLKKMLECMLKDRNLEHERLDRMNAEICGGTTLKSYATLVAYFDGVNVIELGVYSRTTSKQVTRFAEKHGADVIRISNIRAGFRNLLSDFDNSRISGGYANLEDYYESFFA